MEIFYIMISCNSPTNTNLHDQTFVTEPLIVPVGF